MKVYSWNVNGIRAVHRKGALDSFIKKEKPDVLLLQEIKAQEEKIPDELKDDSWARFYNPAEKAGYSGVGIWVNLKHEKKIKSFSKGMPRWKDGEGRIATCEFTNKLVFISVYVPNGGKSEEHYKDKLLFYKLLSSYIKSYEKKGMQVLVGGDFNVALSDLDLSEPDKFRDHTHFNDEVKGKIFKMIEDANVVDTYRSRYPKKEGAFSYWDNFSFSLPKGVKPRDINQGWRLDYFFATKKLDTKITKANIHQKILGSDHCPVSVSF